MTQHKTTMELYGSADGASYGLRVDGQKAWRARTGLGADLERVWKVEIESDGLPDFTAVDWEALLKRVVEAYELSDPVLANFHWPMRHPDTLTASLL